MATQRTVLADGVDRESHAWETVGENIRGSSGGGGSVDLKTLLDIIFPIGSYFIGSIPESWKTVSTWEPQSDGDSIVMCNGSVEPFANIGISGGIGEPLSTINFVVYKRTA